MVVSLLAVWGGVSACAAGPAGAGAADPGVRTEAVPPRPDNPPELGLVRWRRGYEGAVAEARAQHKPLLVLFDEVPGCQTVRTFGAGALSHPLIVEAAETYFVPVFVSNNDPGPDRAVLESFGEPTWNNPAVRFIAPDRTELAPRLYGAWGDGGASLAARMVSALGDEAPDWLRLVALELGAEVAGPETELFGMYCFWQGEAALGGVEGVVGTRTGFAGGREVVEVRLDPARVDRKALRAAAERVGAAKISGTLRPSPRDDRHALIGTPWADVPMVAAQASRVNAAVAAGRDPSRWLSPRQRDVARALRAHPGAPWPDPGGLSRLVGPTKMGR